MLLICKKNSELCYNIFIIKPTFMIVFYFLSFVYKINFKLRYLLLRKIYFYSNISLLFLIFYKETSLVFDLT